MKWVLAGILVLVLFFRDMIAGTPVDPEEFDEQYYSWCALSVVCLILIGALVLVNS